jgi:hypothetical protein
MSVTQRSKKRSIESLKQAADEIAAELNGLADAIDAGEADAEDVAEAHRSVAAQLCHIEDAAETFELIDGEADPWYTLNELRAAMYHTGQMAVLNEADRDVIAPTSPSSRSSAEACAREAAERLEGDE